MTLIIDNYDSFTFNLYQMIGALDADTRVIRNDAFTVDEITAMGARRVVLSPGPGRPSGAGVCKDVILSLGGVVPILGVCLGHQAICEAYGGTVGYARRLMHGKQSVINVDTNDPIFQGLPPRTPVARYHSLALEKGTLPDELILTAAAEDGEVMAVRHKTFPTFGVQFHPESVLTPQGGRILANFLKLGA